MKKCDVGTEVQTLIFSKDNFTEKSAKDWAKKHDFKYGYVDEKENTYRIRQQEPSDFENMRTIEMTEGVKAVIGCPIDEYAEGGGVNISEARIQDAIAHSSKKPEEILSEEVNTDTPKKLNRSEEVVPMSIINEIENEGISIERLESLGLPVYKYQTQITIHGIFEGLTKERVGGYKNLTLNQNKTLGVRYNAIDLEKKKLISNALRLDRYQNEDLASKGFRSRMDSKGFVLSKAKSSQDKSKALEYAKEFKQEAEALPYNFIGGKYVNIYNVYGIYYVEYSIYLNAIRQDNLWGFISAITDGRIDEKKYQEILSLKEAKEKEERADYEKELEEKNRIADEKAKELNNQSPYQSITQLPNAREFAIGFVQSSYGSADIKVYYIFYNKQNRRVFRKKTYKDWADVLPSISKEPTYMEKNLLMPDADLERLNKKVSNGGYFLISETPSAKIIDKKIEIKSEKPKDNTSLDSNDIYEFVETKHTKTGDTIYVLRIKKRLSPAEYKTVEANIKLIRGYYSGFVKGFVLKSKITKNEIERLFEGTSLATNQMPKVEEKIKNITEVDYEDDGNTLLYGTKNNKTRISVNNLSQEDIKNELDFEKKMLNKQKSDLPNIINANNYVQNSITSSLKEKDDSRKLLNSAIKNIEILEKIVIPFYESKIASELPKSESNENLSGENIENIISIINSKVNNQGYSLKEIYDELIKFHGSRDGAIIFSEFIKRKKDEGDTKIMDEFNRTSFVENINPINKSQSNETLSGGKGDNKTIEEIATMHNVTVEYAKEQLEKGIEIESEHTSDREKATEIAKDHLTEFINYYIELKKMETKLEQEAEKENEFNIGDVVSLKSKNGRWYIVLKKESDTEYWLKPETVTPQDTINRGERRANENDMTLVKSGLEIKLAKLKWIIKDRTEKLQAEPNSGFSDKWKESLDSAKKELLELEKSNLEEKTNAPFKFEVGEYVMIIDEPITNNENTYRVIGHANYNSDYGWQITIKNLYSNETVTMFENQLQISDKSEQIKEISKELKESFSEIQQEDIDLHLKVRLEGMENEAELQKAKENYPIVIEWSEGNIPDNVGLNNLDELNSKLIQAGFSSRPTEIYIKNKVWFRGYPSYVRIDVSKQQDDFDFEKQHIRDWLKKYDNRFDWSVFDTKGTNQSEIEELEMLIELTQDSVNENPNDEELSMYLEMLKETLSNLKS